MVHWSVSHATCPTPVKLPNDDWRVFFSTRDDRNRSHVGWSDINLDNPLKILNVSEKPFLKPGPIGNFDGNGIYVSSAVKISDNKLRFYTIGWNPGHIYPLFYASIGVVESEDYGKTVSYRSKAPVLDKSEFDPSSVTGPWVLYDRDIYRMWYVSGLNWIRNKEDKLKSNYHIKYAMSKDGINWIRKGDIAIDFKNKNEINIARPCVLKNNNNYESWFSYGFGGEYKIGYAVSVDGLKFNRNVDEVSVVQTSKESFENKAVCHPAVINHKGKKFMFYNGNSFGIDGIALAESSN